MKVLLDHNVPRKLRRALKGHAVFTADEMHWALLESGHLLRVAEDAGFHVMITGDKSLHYQQNLTGRRLAIIVLRATDWNVLKSNTQSVLDAVNAAVPGSFEAMQ